MEENGKKKRVRKTVTQTELRDSLIEQLERKGANVAVFVDQINSYIFFTVKEREMQKDIQKRGFSYEAISATGKKYMKDNPSVKNALLYNKQRLAILKELGLTITTVESDDEDDY